MRYERFARFARLVGKQGSEHAMLLATAATFDDVRRRLAVTAPLSPFAPEPILG